MLAERVDAGLPELEDCCACPRHCHVNRMADETRVCHTGRYARVASAFPHFGEEDCLRGWKARARSSSASATCAASSARTGTSASRPRRRVPAGTAGRDDARSAEPRLPQHQLRHARARRAADPRGDRRGRPARAAAADRLQHRRLRLGRVAAIARRRRGHLHARLQVLGAGDVQAAGQGKDYPERAREAIVEMHRQVGVLRFGPDGLARAACWCGTW